MNRRLTLKLFEELEEMTSPWSVQLPGEPVVDVAMKMADWIQVRMKAMVTEYRIRSANQRSKQHSRADIK